jgi:hypothetical protein
MRQWNILLAQEAAGRQFAVAHLLHHSTTDADVVQAIARRRSPAISIAGNGVGTR